jgi:hypothetical protein
MPKKGDRIDELIKLGAFVLPPPVKPVVEEESLVTPEQPYTWVERRPEEPEEIA